MHAQQNSYEEWWPLLKFIQVADKYLLSIEINEVLFLNSFSTYSPFAATRT